MANITWTNKQCRIDQLIEWEQNPVTIKDADARQLATSVKKYRGVIPYIAAGPRNKDGTYDLLDGHQRKKVEVEINHLPPNTQVDVRVPSRKLTTAERREIVVRLRKNTGQFDYDKLQEWFPAEELLEHGFTESELIKAGFAIGKAALDAEPQWEKAKELQRKWKTDQGQLWQLGRHRLLIDDCTKAKNVKRLMHGALADLVYTDPPYGVSYIGVNNPNGREWEELENDNLRGDALQEMLTQAFANAYNYSDQDTALYTWHASATQIQFENALVDNGYQVKQQLIWNKGMVLGHSDYHWAHEPVFYCRKKGQRTPWYGDRTGKTILGSARAAYIELDKEVLVNIIEAIANNSTAWEVDRDAVQDYMHPTQKPTRLAIRAITNSCKPGGNVLDLFVGSGTTVIAAENTEAIGYAMDNDPQYGAVTIQRYKDAFPKQQVKQIK